MEEKFIKMKNFIVVCILLVALGSCKSSYTKIGEKNANYIPYYLKVYEADSLFIAGKYMLSYKILDELFKKYEPINMDNYVEYGTYLNAALMSNNIVNFKTKVRNGYLKYGGITTICKESYELQMKVNEMAGLKEDEIKRLKMDYYNNLDILLRGKLLKMYEDDQNARIENPTQEKMDIVDEHNRYSLNKIFKEYKFPTKKLIGSNNAWDIPDGGTIQLNIFFMHQNDSVRSKYLPILWDGVKKGYCEPNVYAIVFDRDLILKNKKIYFGTYSCGINEVCDVQEPEALDSIRKSIGLPHINYDKWRYGSLESEIREY